MVHGHDYLYGETDTYVFPLDSHGIPDLSGEIEVLIGDGRDMDPSQVRSVRLSGKDLLAFLAHFMRMEQAARLAMMSDRQILGTYRPKSEGRLCPDPENPDGVCYPSYEEGIKECCHFCYEKMPEYGGPEEITPIDW